MYLSELALVSSILDAPVLGNLHGMGASSISSAHEPRAKEGQRTEQLDGMDAHTGVCQELPEAHLLALLLWRSCNSRSAS